MNPLPPWRPQAFRAPDLVLHWSLFLEWSLIRPQGDYANALMSKMPRVVSAVPTLWSCELSQALLDLETANRITPTRTVNCLASVHAFQIVVDREASALAWTDILDLARARSVSVNDAAYLELCLRLNLPLATTDAALARAAGAAGVPTFTP